MPWNETKPMDERLKFIGRLLEGEKMAPLCREFGISRVTSHKIFNRYKECGLDGLYDRSRAPCRQANQLPYQVERTILGIKKEYPSWGAPKICDKLIRQYPMIPLPAISTIHAALAADPNSKGAAASFGTMAQYLPLRIASMRDQLPAAPPPPAEPGQIHVGDLDGSSVSTGKNNWDASVSVTVHDYVHAGNVSGAAINGTWSGGVAGATVCNTNVSGQCSFDATVTKKNLRKVSFTVTSVALAGSTYLSGLNHDDEGDSDGNSISVNKP